MLSLPEMLALSAERPRPILFEVVEATNSGRLLTVMSVEVEVVAKSSVPLTERFPKRLVEEALMTPKNDIGVEVALVLTTKLMDGVNQLPMPSPTELVGRHTPRSA